MILIKNDEKIILASRLSEIINADGIISNNERKYLKWVQSNFGLSTMHIQQGQNYDVNLAIQILKNMSNEKKSAFCKIIRTMGNIDGNPFEATKETVEHIIIKIGRAHV